MHIELPEMLYCGGLEDFYTIDYHLFAKNFLENSAASITNFFAVKPSRETQNR